MENTEDNLMREAEALSKQPVDDILSVPNLDARARAILILIDDKNFPEFSSRKQLAIYNAFPDIKQKALDEIELKRLYQNPHARKSLGKLEWDIFVEKLRETYTVPRS